jgi:hypothetical protein
MPMFVTEGTSARRLSRRHSASDGIPRPVSNLPTPLPSISTEIPKRKKVPPLSPLSLPLQPSSRSPSPPPQLRVSRKKGNQQRRTPEVVPIRILLHQPMPLQQQPRQRVPAAERMLAGAAPLLLAHARLQHVAEPEQACLAPAPGRGARQPDACDAAAVALSVRSCVCFGARQDVGGVRRVGARGVVVG